MRKKDLLSSINGRQEHFRRAVRIAPLKKVSESSFNKLLFDFQSLILRVE